MLRQTGFEYASLFFQWTWHTPEIPREESPAIRWVGHDGSTIIAASRHALNIHQWPEDVELTLQTLPESSAQTPLLLQWLELMPSPDWMCRSEVLPPKMRELFADPRFEVETGTLPDYLSKFDPESLPERKYAPHETWHGMTLGKNADRMRRLSQSAEHSIQTAETLAAILGAFGRPYAQWDVYPTWELEEAWRQLLAGQHHDNEECEGLCGSVGHAMIEKAETLAGDVLKRQWTVLGADADDIDAEPLVFNPLGWPRKWRVINSVGASTVEVPAFGWTCVDLNQTTPDAGEWHVQEGQARFVAENLEINFDMSRGEVVDYLWRGVDQLQGQPLFEWIGEFGGIGPAKLVQIDGFDQVHPHVLRVKYHLQGADESFILILKLEPHLATGALEIEVWGSVPRPEPGMNRAFGWRMPVGSRTTIRADHPYGVSSVVPQGKFHKKYPTGDWMTSPQWFEDIDSPFTGLSFVDFSDQDGNGMMVTFPGARQWFREADGSCRMILTAYDPWDEDNDLHWFANSHLFMPHAAVSPSDLWKAAQEFVRPCPEAGLIENPPAERLSFATTSPDNVAITALYREESAYSGMYLDAYAGTEMDHPYVFRLVELDGVASNVELTIAGTIVKAVRADLSGRPAGHTDVMNNKIHLEMRPHEIATIYVDIEEGRKQVRDLDAKREIWATVHRV